jgi:hypothetical protein
MKNRISKIFGSNLHMVVSSVLNEIPSCLLRSFQTGLFITVSTAVHYWVLYRYELRQSLFSHDISISYVLILFSQLNFGIPLVFVPSRFPCQCFCESLASLMLLTCVVSLQ